MVEGNGIEKNISEAKRLLKLAEKAGETRATPLLAALNLNSSQGNSNSAIIKKEEASKSRAIDFGNYYALIIANNNYEYLEPLNSPLPDGKALKDILETDFGFDVKLLSNATRLQILETLNSYRGKLRKDDNFLIYYAGHGNIDEDTKEGYWQAVDARPESKGTWLANSEIINELAAIKSQHVLVVADSCFSGAMMKTRGAMFVQQKEDLAEEAFKKNRELKVRNVISSGGYEVVPDYGPDNHSIFASQFLKALRQISQPTSAFQVYSGILPGIKLNSEQSPLFGRIRNIYADPDGFFYFVKSETSYI